MSNDGEVKYVWAVAWENRFAQQHTRGMVFYDVELLPDVTMEEFEKFLAEEALPSVGGITTRTYQFNQQSLLSYSDVVGPDPLHEIQKAGVAAKLATLCRITTDKNLYVVMDSGTASGGSLDS